MNLIEFDIRDNFKDDRNKELMDGVIELYNGWEIMYIYPTKNDSVNISVKTIDQFLVIDDYKAKVTDLDNIKSAFLKEDWTAFNNYVEHMGHYE